MSSEEKFKYKIIENYIIDNIRNGTFKANSMLPTNQWFCEHFHVSRTTVQKAYQVLIENGIVETIQGSGCYVRTPRLNQQKIYMSSFSEEYTKKGYRVSTRLIFYAVKQVKDFRLTPLSKKMGLRPNDAVHYFERVRFGNDVPFSVQYTYITKDIVPEIPLAYLSSSIYSYLENVLQLELGDGASMLSVILPPEDIALLLKIPKTEPVVYVEHISRLASGAVIEYVDSYIKYDKFTLQYVNKRD